MTWKMTTYHEKLDDDPAATKSGDKDGTDELRLPDQVPGMCTANNTYGDSAVMST
jgi:hypothetical protein